jgi:hypothetical protein
MFNIGNILKRSWQILWSYKLLWVFALLIALTGGGGSTGPSSLGSGSRYTTNFSQNFENFNVDPGTNMPQWMAEFEIWANQHLTPLFATEERAIQTVVLITLCVIAFFLVVGLLLALIRYPAETAVIRMVDSNAQTGEKLKFKSAWKLGWNRRAFRIWLVDLLIGTPGFVLFIIVFGIFIYLLVRIGMTNNYQFMPGVIIGIVFAGFFMLAFSLFMAVVTLIRQYIVRFAAIEGTTIGESFSHGWGMFKRNWKNTVLMGLVMIGVGIAVGIALTFAAFLLIPAYAILAIPGLIVAAIPGGIVYVITSIFSSGALPWILGGLVALPFFVTIVFSPASLLSGAYAVYTSNVWTLTFRSIKGMETPPPAVLPIPQLDEPPALPSK